jgi:Zn-dependent peptidase ImmA (M78 family)
MSDTLPVSDHAVALWLREAEREIGDTELRRFDPDRLRGVVPAIRPLSMALIPASAIEQTRELLASAGVGLMLVKGIRGAPASGAVRWVRNSPWILLTLRHKTDDHLWFSLFHELGHLLEGGRRGDVVEQVPDQEHPIRADETAANAFAREALLPDFQADQLWPSGPPDRTTIREIAAEYGVAPGIVVGRLERDKRIPPGQFRDLKRAISNSSG